MSLDPSTFLRRAIEMGLLTPSQAAQAGAIVRARAGSGEEVRIERLVFEMGILDREGVGRVIQSLRASGGRSGRGVSGVGGTSPRTVATSSEDSSSDRPVPGPRPVVPGKSLPIGAGPKYETVELLGRGGMGMVVLARDRQIGREVAVKRILEPDPDAVRRFVFESQVTGQLEHPNIVPVYELGVESETELPYLVMKRLEGRSLAEHLAQIRSEERGDASGRTLGRLLEIFLKICDAVAYAHSRGVIHRDLKPANVMVGEFGEVHVVDWGLAKIVGTADRPGVAATGAPDDALRTREGSVSGTPMYMAPEQARGEVSRLDATSDVYSLGAILYESLALRAPFEERDLASLLEKVVNGEWTPISERSVAPWGIPRELAAVASKAMACRQEDRYPSARELREEVESYLAGRTLRAFEYSPWALLVKWTRRHRTAAIGSVATVAALILGLLATAIGVSSARRAEAEKIRREKVERAEGLFAAAQEIRATVRGEFDPASAQEYFLVRLPIAVDMAKAIQEHPEPPESWEAELATFAGELQARAEEGADWALAEHLAQSVGAWGVVPLAESEARQKRAREKRKARIEADLARLDDLLRRMVEADEKPVRQGLLPGEVDECARMAARLENRPQVARQVLSIVAKDNDRRQRKWNVIQGRDFHEPTRSRNERLLCARILGSLGDAASRAPEGTAPEIVARTLERSWEMRLRTDEIATWIRVATAIELARPGSFRDPGLATLFRQTVKDFPESFLVRQAIHHAQALLEASQGGPIPAGEELEGRLAEWVAAVSARELEFTGRLLEKAESDLPARAVGFVFDQLGLRGDRRAPESDRPGRTAVSVLRRALEEPPDEALRDAALDGPGGHDAALWQAKAAEAAENLARLEDAGSARSVLVRREASGRLSLFWNRTALALRLFPIDNSGPATTFDDAFDRGILLAARGQLEAAIVELDRAIEIEPLRADGLCERADCKWNLGDLSGALEDLERAIALAPGEALLYQRRGTYQAYEGRIGRAFEDLSRAIDLAPGDPSSLAQRALVRQMMGDAPGALEDYSAAAASDPHFAPAYSGRSGVLRFLGDHARALADADRWLALEPWSAPAHWTRGMSLQAMGRHQEAVEEFTHAIDLDPDQSGFYRDRVGSRLVLGDRAGGIEDLDRLIELEPNAMNHRRRGRARFDDQDLEGALADVEEALRLDSRDAMAYSLRGMVREARKDVTAALADYDRAIELDPRLSEPHVKRGILRLEGSGDLARAIEDLSRALDIEDTYQARVARAEAHLRAGLGREAEMDARRGIEIDPAAWEAWVFLGRALVLAGDAGGADRALREALARAPESVRRGIEDERRRLR